jgi:hypothetical protein
MPVARLIAFATAATAVGVLLFGFSTRTVAAGRAAEPVASVTVPNLGIGPSTTVADAKAAASGWDVRVVKEISGGNNLIVLQQYPEPDSEIEVTQGQIMHLMVAGSGSGGFWNDPPTLQKIVVVELVFIIAVLFVCRLRRIRS